ncbi:DDE superfamily endonuclease-domain-containing protein, partial [Mycena epipterygia]
MAPPTSHELPKEERIALALADIAQGKYSYREAAVLYRVSSSTLNDRAHGKRPTHLAHQDQQLVSEAQEKVLIDWCHHLTLTAHPLNRQTLIPKVKLLVGQDPGKHWTSGLDPKRARAFNPTSMNDYFQKLTAIMEEKKIPWRNVYNMDEKGIQLGGGRKNRGVKYILSRQSKARYRSANSDLELVTIIECICADGSAMKPGFVFKGKILQKQWFTEEAKGAGCVSENGWTDDNLTKDWFEKVFIPTAQARNITNNGMLLIWDGQRSHETMLVIELALAAGIDFFAFPTKTTHKAQPLDVGIFGPTERKWGEKCDELADIGHVVTKDTLIPTYLEVRKAVMTQSNILSAFRKTGIRPINPNVFTEDDYAPSWTTSTESHLPRSY